MDNLFIIASEMNGVDTNKFQQLLQSLEAKKSKSILNKDNSIEKVEKLLQRLKMSSDRYKEYPSEELSEEMKKLVMETQIVLELFKEDSLHKDQELHDKYAHVLEEFVGEI